METSSLQKNRPHLETVFGPLSAENDSEIRTILGEIDEILLEIARHVGRDRAGWDGTGLELTWAESGQTEISSFVGTCTQRGACVDFCIALRPSWYFGERSSVLTWEIELNVYADCGHTVDHSHMHSVYEANILAESAVHAAVALRTTVLDLKRLATENPIEKWLKLASDPEATVDASSSATILTSEH